MALGRQLGVSYNTAWSLKHKLMQVMKERDESGRLGHIVQVDDAYLGGETRGGKRGRGAEGKTPFVAGAGHRRRPAGGVADELRERVPQAGDSAWAHRLAAGDGGLLGRTGLFLSTARGSARRRAWGG